MILSCNSHKGRCFVNDTSGLWGKSLKCLKQQAIKTAQCCVNLVSSAIIKMMLKQKKKSEKKEVGLTNPAQLGFELCGHYFESSLTCQRQELDWPIGSSWNELYVLYQNCGDLDLKGTLKWLRPVPGFIHREHLRLRKGATCLLFLDLLLFPLEPT